MQKISLSDYLKSYPFYLLPKHFLSALIHRFMRIKNELVKNNQIKLFIKAFPVNMQEAVRTQAEDYVDFNDFFTRSLKADVRDLTQYNDKIISPVDGQISESGKIEDEQLIQAKGQHFSLTELLAGNAELANQFKEGTFLTIYLSPKDYHRIHMPLKGKLQQMVHVPGELFSVNNSSVKIVPRLFARNERVINIFETAAGSMALIQVGAIFVSSIETVWHGEISPPRKKFIQNWNYPNSTIELSQAEEMGRFNMGSTVVLLFAKNRIKLSEQLTKGDNIQLGNIIGDIL
ncbi:MAG: archaetidylserine decarboxylase [Pseudomonadota bacterium]